MLRTAFWFWSACREGTPYLEPSVVDGTHLRDIEDTEGFLYVLRQEPVNSVIMLRNLRATTHRYTQMATQATASACGTAGNRSHLPHSSSFKKPTPGARNASPD
eukprot:1188931-Prorocentrum_minimum.AAC.3